MQEELKAFLEHLSFLGYEFAADNGKVLRISHRTHFNFRLRKFRGGLILSIVLPIDAKAVEQNPIEYYKTINAFNTAAIVARYYDHENKAMYLESWASRDYDRAAFSMFMDNWHLDTDRFANEHWPLLKPYFPTKESA